MHGILHVVCICGQSAISYLLACMWWVNVNVHGHTVQSWVGESSTCMCISAAHCSVVYWCVLPCGGNENAVSTSSEYMYQSALCVSTDVSLHCNWILCPGFHIWDAMALLVLVCLTAALCSAIRVFNHLPVSPMYTEPHSQGIWYTMPFCFLGGVGVLTWVRRFLRLWRIPTLLNH